MNLLRAAMIVLLVVVVVAALVAVALPYAVDGHVG